MKHVGKLLPTPLNINDKRWYFLSIFYARENWAILIAHIIHFYQERKNQFCSLLISFSEEKGEHIQVIFVSFLNNDNYLYEIQTYFQTFVDQNPSVIKIQLFYKKTVWDNLSNNNTLIPNNTLTWNKFMLSHYSEQYICFHQKTIDVALKLAADDFSADSFLSLGIYLLVKGFWIVRGKRKNVLSQTRHEISANIENNIINEVNELIKDKIDISDVCETIEFYINENNNEYSPELINWLNAVNNFLKYYDYTHFCFFTCKIIGLNILHQVMILELMNIWYNNRQGLLQKV